MIKSSELKYSLIADAGGTKTHWCLSGPAGDVHEEFFTEGINAAVMSHEDVHGRLAEVFGDERLAGADIREVYFYGAGCLPGLIPGIRDSIKSFLDGDDVRVEVASDMLGAARAVCGHAPGIVAIFGTGSNSCQYDGESIVSNTPPLGYILGDEGSGARLGALMVNGVLKGWLPVGVCEEFLTRTRLTQAEIIERVYRRAGANTFLASLVPEIVRCMKEPAVGEMVQGEMMRFFKRNVLNAYDTSLPVNFVGTLSVVLQDVLAHTLDTLGLQMGRVMAKPMDGLAMFHTHNQI